MKKLLLNGFIFSFPLLVCVCFFLADDPFGVFYKDKCLSEASEDVIRTRHYLNSKDQYTSFIFGNSRTHAFREKDWEKFIGDERIFHYGCPGESLLNIKKKLEMILKKQKIKNVLILIDAGILENTDNKHRYYQGPVYNHSPLTSNISYFDFYANYIGYYFSDYFFAKHIYYAVTSNYKNEWMKEAFKDPANKELTIKSNKYETLADSLIENDFRTYKSTFNPDYNDNEKKIKTIAFKDSIYLVEIKKMLDDNAVNYKIVIPPDFHKKKIAPAIYKTLNAIAGKNVYDLTGVNKITTDSTLNYENLHFTAKAGLMIMDSIYKN